MNNLSPQRLQRAQYVVVITVVLFVGVMVLSAVLAGGKQVIEHITRISPTVVALLLLLSLVNYFTRGYRWQFLSRHIGLEVPGQRSLLYYFAGFSMTTTPGKVGELLRLWLIERCHGYSYTKVGPLFIGDRLGDMNAMLVLCLVGITAFSGYLWLALTGCAAVLLLTWLFVRPAPLISATGWLYAVTGRNHSRLFAKMRHMLRMTTHLFTLRSFSVVLALSVAGWLAECVAFYILLHALSVDVTLQQAIFIFSFSMLAGAISMLPGGLGGVEVGMIGLLMALGVESHLAVTATAIIRLTTLWFAVGLGFAVLPFALQLARCSTSESVTVDRAA